MKKLLVCLLLMAFLLTGCTERIIKIDNNQVDNCEKLCIETSQNLSCDYYKWRTDYNFTNAHCTCEVKGCV